MKSQLFKTAWKLVKEMKMSFSDALKLSWKSFKNCAKIIVNKTWKGVFMVSFSKENCTSGTIEGLLKMIDNSKTLCMDGAKSCYDGKTFNND